MLIVDGFASCDQDNCMEISRASDLIPKNIGFTSYYRSGTTYADAQRKVPVKSSLKLLHRLISVEGEIGITLQRKVSKHLFLLRNLAEILGESRSSQELRTLVAGILRNIAIYEKAREAIGRIQVIITRLMEAFLSPDRPSSAGADRLLRKAAGQALAMLVLECVKNCLVMLRDMGYDFIRELTSMIHVDTYRCVAASLLQNICLHARPELKEPDLKELSYILKEVLERILIADGAELEIFIGLSSQICKVIPGDFAREVDDGQIKERFVKRLIDRLNAYMEPSALGIRRVILGQAMNMMEYDSRYTKCFSDHRIMEALSMVEETASDSERTTASSWAMQVAGLMVAGEALSSLVARAKQLLAIR